MMKKLFFIAALVVSAMSGATQYVKVTDVNKLQSGDTIQDSVVVAETLRPYVSNTMAPIQIYRKLQTPAVPIAVEGVEMDYTELTIREYYSHDTITDALDFGKVEYDDSWGTETNPYVASKTLQFITKWQSEPIALSLYSGKVFALYTESIPVAGGTASIGFDTDTKGTYTDTLYVQTADTLIKIFLSAEAVDPEEILPKLTLSTRNLYLNPNLDNSNRDMAEMAFSVENLAKNLYIKWESTEPNTVPTWQGTELTLYAGNDLHDVYYGESTNMGTATRTDEPILLEVYTWQTGTFESNLCFYTFKEGSKTDYAFEERVHITIVVDEEYDPVGPTDFRQQATGNRQQVKLIKDGRFVIVRDGRGYDVLGVEE